MRRSSELDDHQALELEEVARQQRLCVDDLVRLAVSGENREEYRAERTAQRRRGRGRVEQFRGVFAGKPVHSPDDERDEAWATMTARLAAAERGDA